MNNNKLLESNI